MDKRAAVKQAVDTSTYTVSNKGGRTQRECASGGLGTMFLSPGAILDIWLNVSADDCWKAVEMGFVLSGLLVASQAILDLSVFDGNARLETRDRAEAKDKWY
jgi:hypothetical protein